MRKGTFFFRFVAGLLAVLMAAEPGFASGMEGIFHRKLIGLSPRMSQVKFEAQAITAAVVAVRRPLMPREPFLARIFRTSMFWLAAGQMWALQKQPDYIPIPDHYADPDRGQGLVLFFKYGGMLVASALLVQGLWWVWENFPLRLRWRIMKRFRQDSLSPAKRVKELRIMPWTGALAAVKLKKMLRQKGLGWWKSAEALNIILEHTPTAEIEVMFATGDPDDYHRKIYKTNHFVYVPDRGFLRKIHFILDKVDKIRLEGNTPEERERSLFDSMNWHPLTKPLVHFVQHDVGSYANDNAWMGVAPYDEESAESIRRLETQPQDPEVLKIWSQRQLRRNGFFTLAAMPFIGGAAAVIGAIPILLKGGHEIVVFAAAAWQNPVAGWAAFGLAGGAMAVAWVLRSQTHASERTKTSYKDLLAEQA